MNVFFRIRDNDETLSALYCLFFHLRENPNTYLGPTIRVRQGQKIVILNFGTLLPIAIKAAEQLNATVIDMRFVKPLDTQVIKDLANSHEIILTLEENVIMGGAGSAVNEYLVANDLLSKVKVRNIGLPDHYQDHGDKNALLADVGISVEGIIQLIKPIM